MSQDGRNPVWSPTEVIRTRCHEGSETVELLLAETTTVLMESDDRTLCTCMFLRRPTVPQTMSDKVLSILWHHATRIHQVERRALDVGLEATVRAYEH